MRVFISLVCFLALVPSSYYAFKVGGLNYYAASITSLAAFLTSIANIPKKKEKDKKQLSQKLKNQSIGNQSEGNITQSLNIRGMKNEPKSKD